ncbi:MAG: pyridoxine 5'-phosphate synthase, partial [Elusimicrobiota bacterium]
IRDIIYALKQAGIEISLFIEPSIKFIKEAAEVGADAVELHTGKYANTSGPEKNEELNKIIKSAKQAKKEGLKVNAGHGLNYDNVTAVSKIKELSELNIGYSIVCRSIFTGLKKAVRDMSDLIKNCD